MITTLTPKYVYDHNNYKMHMRHNIYKYKFICVEYRYKHNTHITTVVYNLVHTYYDQ